MKCVVQRVSRARVVVDGETVGEVGRGMLLLVCAVRGDTDEAARLLALKVAQFRFFPDESGKMNRSALEVGAGALVVSQFTLAADGRAGRRPSFDDAAPPAEARPLVEVFEASLRDLGLCVAAGRFGAHMEVELVNDGPVTFVLESPVKRPSARGGDPSQVLA